ncbi:MAG: hypothetical protein IJ568_02060 [Bacilli bacterium]|nr:hypothetical protein [Bacilli bacterium]
MYKKTIINILSFLYSSFLIIGTSFFVSHESKLILDNIFLSILIFVFLFLLFKHIISFVFKYLDNIDSKKNKKDIKVFKKYKDVFERHPFIVSFITILVFWLPYIIAYYPAILSPDPSFQIRQYFGIPNKYSTYSVMIDPNVTITNHHPVLHTLLLGTCLKIGNSIGNDNFGLFIYSIIQITVLLSTLSYTIYYMKKMKSSFNFRFIILLIYSLVPMFPMYAMSSVKDVLYSSFIILYTIEIYNILKSKDKINIIRVIYVFIISLLIILFRNNGFYILILSFPFLLINKINRKKVLILLLLIVSFNFSYNKVILPYFKITPTSIREALSIPFQQSARYVKYNKVSKEEYKVYDKLLDMRTLAARYDPELSDPVKNKFNRNYTSEDLKEYFKVWLRDFFKDPKTYIDATVNNTYGYFYPVPIKWYVYHKYDTRIVNNGFNYHYNSLKPLRGILYSYAKYFVYIPVLGLISNIGFNTWVLLFMIGYLLYRKKYSSLIVLSPHCATLLVCIASPANAYFRYSMPYIFSMGVLISLFIKEIKNRA